MSNKCSSSPWCLPFEDLLTGGAGEFSNSCYTPSLLSCGREAQPASPKFQLLPLYNVLGFYEQTFIPGIWANSLWKVTLCFFLFPLETQKKKKRTLNFFASNFLLSPIIAINLHSIPKGTIYFHTSAFFTHFHRALQKASLFYLFIQQIFTGDLHGPWWHILI